ncbi:MAG: hypothetical protein ABI548_19615 [Polyangiaceae bacterium]
MTRLSALRSKRSNLLMTVALVAAVALAVGLAIETSGVTSAASLPAAEVAVAAPAATVEPADSPGPAADEGLSGQVLEAIPVSKYTYLRLRTASGEVWAAVPSAAIAIGTQVTLENATRMDDFKSSTLNKTFAIIYFGTLAPVAGAPQKFSPSDVPPLDDDSELPPGHPDIGAGSPSAPTNIDPSIVVHDGDPLPPGHPDISNRTPSAALPRASASPSR